MQHMRAFRNRSQQRSYAFCILIAASSTPDPHPPLLNTCIPSAQHLSTRPHTPHTLVLRVLLYLFPHCPSCLVLMKIIGRVVSSELRSQMSSSVSTGWNDVYVVNVVVLQGYPVGSFRFWSLMLYETNAYRPLAFGWNLPKNLTQTQLDNTKVCAYSGFFILHVFTYC